jgi:hypothetical protein
MATKKTRKSPEHDSPKRKASAKKIVEDIHPEEEYYDAQAELEVDNDPERPGANGTLEDNPEADDEERSEEYFHKLKGKSKKHPRIDEAALKDVNYHSPGGKSSRFTGTNVRRKKSQF